MHVTVRSSKIGTDLEEVRYARWRLGIPLAGEWDGAAMLQKQRVDPLCIIRK